MLFVGHAPCFAVFCDAIDFAHDRGEVMGCRRVAIGALRCIFLKLFQIDSRRFIRLRCCPARGGGVDG
ncbi:hypothetical protein D3C81_2161320 [compost metagenome]